MLGHPFDAMEQTQELELVEEVTIGGRQRAPHRGAHTQRAQQDRLELRKLVLGQQRLGREQACLAEDVGVGQVGEQGALDGVADHAVLGRHRRQHGRAIEGRVLGRAARAGGAREEGAPQLHRIQGRILFEVAAVEYQFL